MNITIQIKDTGLHYLQEINKTGRICACMIVDTMNGQFDEVLKQAPGVLPCLIDPDMISRAFIS